jgi:hypothetical protein
MPRFSDNRDGTVTDNLSGIVWLRDADCFGRLTWADALKATAGLASGACGLAAGKFKAGNFRLPNVKELQSLVDFGLYTPAVTNAAGTSKCTDGDCAFTGLGGGQFYWSSTSRVDFTNMNPPGGKAWGVHMGNGRTLARFKATRPAITFVWPVKAGPIPGLRPALLEATGQTQCWDPADTSEAPAMIPCTDPRARGQDGAVRAGVPYPSPRFRDNGDGTVTDNLTRLVWLKDADCFGTDNWPMALAQANGLDVGSCGLSARRADWRLPNVKELQSLIDFGAATSTTGPALPIGHPFENVNEGNHWSSTTANEPVDTACAWAVSVRSGLTHFNAGGSGRCVPLPGEPPPEDPPDEPPTPPTKLEGDRSIWPVRGGR